MPFWGYYAIQAHLNNTSLIQSVEGFTGENAFPNVALNNRLAFCTLSLFAGILPHPRLFEKDFLKCLMGRMCRGANNGPKGTLPFSLARSRFIRHFYYRVLPFPSLTLRVQVSRNSTC